MELFDNLASVGLSVGVLQVAIILGITAVVIGMFWKMIAIGLGVLFCAVVLAIPSKKPEPKVEVKPAQVEEVKIPEKVPDSGQKQMTEEEMFLGDCVVYGGLSLNECKNLWADRMNGVEPARLSKNWKKQYMQRVKNGSI